MPSPGVSVVVPTRNRSGLALQTIRSLSTQRLAGFEVLIVDDASEASHGRRIADAVATDARFRWIGLDAWAGANACRNRGAREAEGEFLVFLDSDDLLAPHALLSRVAALRARPDLGFVVSEGEVFEQRPGDLGLPWNEPDPASDLDRFLRCDTPWQTTGATWRREAFLECGAFDEDALSWQDWALHVRALARSVRYARIPGVDHYHRIRSTDSIRSRHAELPRLLALAGTLGRVRETLEENGLLDRERSRLMLGLFARAAVEAVRFHGPVPGRQILERAADHGLLSAARREQAERILSGATDTADGALHERLARCFPEAALVASSARRLRARLEQA